MNVVKTLDHVLPYGSYPFLWHIPTSRHLEERTINIRGGTMDNAERYSSREVSEEEDEEEVSPPWGTIPAEIYLLVQQTRESSTWRI